MVTTALYKASSMVGTEASTILYKATSMVRTVVSTTLYKASSVVGTVAITNLYKASSVVGTVACTTLYKAYSMVGTVVITETLCADPNITQTKITLMLNYRHLNLNTYTFNNFQIYSSIRNHTTKYLSQNRVWKIKNVCTKTLIFINANRICKVLIVFTHGQLKIARNCVSKHNQKSFIFCL